MDVKRKDNTNVTPVSTPGIKYELRVVLITKRKYAHVASNAEKINDVNNLFTSLGRDILETVLGVGVGDMGLGGVFILRIYSVESRDGTPSEGRVKGRTPTNGHIKYNRRGCIVGVF